MSDEAEAYLLSEEAPVTIPQSIIIEETILPLDIISRNVAYMAWRTAMEAADAALAQS